MSARNSMVNVLGPLEGAQIPGGCDTCDAYQTVGAVEHGIWMITVHHDDGCPVLKRYEEGRR
jgi:hypothetical protein